MVVPRRSYGLSLGMWRTSQLKRQLEVDLPRSDVHGSDGERITSADGVTSATPFGRFCTQAVCAPVLEWFLEAGLHAREMPTGHHPLRVRISKDGGVTVTKRLLVEIGIVDVGVLVSRDHVVVSSRPVDGSLPPRRLRVTPVPEPVATEDD